MAFRDRTIGIEGDTEICPTTAASPDTTRQRALSAGSGPVRSAAAGPAGAPQTLRRAELALAGQGRPIPRRPVRVPLGAVVPPGSTMPAPAQKTSRLATDPRLPEAAAPSRAPRGKTAYILREAVTVVLFLATLAAMYHLGRVHAFQNVIIVPEPWNPQSRLG